MDYEDLIENLDGSAFGLLTLVGVGLAAIMARRARRQYRRVRCQIGDVPAQCRLTGKAVAERLLAAAHAEAHELEEAVRWHQRCLDESPTDEQPGLQTALHLFRQGKPLRQQTANPIYSSAAGR